MNTSKKLTGLALAAAAATMFATAPMSASADEYTPVGCMGVNACKGKGACKTADNACKGHNACKGKGMVKMSKESCEAVGGSVRSLSE